MEQRTDWSQGYPVHAAHRFLYHRTTGPAHAAHVLRQSGFRVPALHTCCELGFGQGVSLAVHAAMGDEWWGTDVMPGQVAQAGELVDAGVHLSDEGFAEFCVRPDLPDFDYVCIFGVWSWISDANRRCVLDFLRRKLRPGGVLHLSYNTAVGWSAVMPLRHLLMRALATQSAPAVALPDAVDAALSGLHGILEASSYAAQNPLALQIMERMQAAGGRMIVHEYLGRHWTLFDHATLAAEMATAKLDYACPASRLPMLPELYLTPDQRALLDGIPDPGFRESVQEILTGERYCRDYWIKGARRLPSDAAARLAGRLRYVLAVPPDLVTVCPDLPQGQRHIPRAVFGPVLDALADYYPRSRDEIGAACLGMTAREVDTALLLLWDAGAVQPAQDDEAFARAVPGCRRLYARLLDLAQDGGAIEHLADPVTGGALAVPRLHQLLLRAAHAGQEGFGPAAAFLSGAAGAPVLEPAAYADFTALHRPLLRAHGVI